MTGPKRLEKKMGAVVWYRYCPVNKLSVEDMDDLAAYDVFLRQKLDFPVIGNPKNQSDGSGVVFWTPIFI